MTKEELMKLNKETLASIILDMQSERDDKNANTLEEIASIVSDCKKTAESRMLRQDKNAEELRKKCQDNEMEKMFAKRYLGQVQAYTKVLHVLKILGGVDCVN